MNQTTVRERDLMLEMRSGPSEWPAAVELVQISVPAYARSHVLLDLFQDFRAPIHVVVGSAEFSERDVEPGMLGCLCVTAGPFADPSAEDCATGYMDRFALALAAFEFEREYYQIGPHEIRTFFFTTPVWGEVLKKHSVPICCGLIGRSVKTLQRWDYEGTLTARRTATDRRYYTPEQYLKHIGQKATPDKKQVVYCRVSSPAQKGDLKNQRLALEQFCAGRGIAVSERLEDVGSGLNYGRKNFVRLMDMGERGEVVGIVIARKDRLVRFGYEWFERFCGQHGTKIVVMNAESLSPEAEMTKDLLSIVHCFSSRLYGLRKYKKQIAELVKGDPDADSQTSEPGVEPGQMGSD